MKINNLDKYIEKAKQQGAFPDSLEDWQSPIEIMMGQMQTKIDGDIMKAVQSYGINVNEAELIKAINYDRNQFEKGYISGKTEKTSEWIKDDFTGIVECQKCRHVAPIDITSGEYEYSHFCPGCGSFMLGGES